ncbi:Na+/H+ antiporter subunit E [Dietzia sp. 179-F 9C3 NHS]|uniref:Na+/H+ antiporter subunit E n=1 Tax=Dietzia sp. 179-F 9C3 NHS TaxID=3374295 RepID=UPI003879727F
MYDTTGTPGRPRLDARVAGSRMFMSLWLTFAWVMLWGTLEIGTIAAGFLVALTVMLLLPLPRVPVEGLVRPISTIWLLIVIAYFLVRSSLQVAWLSVRPAPPPRAAVLPAPMRLKSDFCLALAVNTLNLMPGGIVVRVDPLARYVYVHVLDAGSDAAIERFHTQVATIERLYVRAFERPEDWRHSPAPYIAPTEEYEGEEFRDTPAQETIPDRRGPAGHEEGIR